MMDTRERKVYPMEKVDNRKNVKVQPDVKDKLQAAKFQLELANESEVLAYLLELFVRHREVQTVKEHHSIKNKILMESRQMKF